MVPFICLLVMSIVGVVFALVSVTIGSLAFTAVFGDVIIIGLLTWLIVKYVMKHWK